MSSNLGFLYSKIDSISIQRQNEENKKVIENINTLNKNDITIEEAKLDSSLILTQHYIKYIILLFIALFLIIYFFSIQNINFQKSGLKNSGF